MLLLHLIPFLILAPHTSPETAISLPLSLDARALLSIISSADPGSRRRRFFATIPIWPTSSTHGRVSSLHGTANKIAAEASSHQAELHRLGSEVSTKWAKHEVDHVAVNARIGSLEELRRLDNIHRGREETSEIRHTKMEGFQLCLEVQIANGTFNRRLLNIPAFMEYVKDKDGLLIKLAEKDRQIP